MYRQSRLAKVHDISCHDAIRPGNTSGLLRDGIFNVLQWRRHIQNMSVDGRLLEKLEEACTFTDCSTSFDTDVPRSFASSFARSMTSSSNRRVRFLDNTYCAGMTC